MYTGVLYHDCIIVLYIKIGYTIGIPSKLYEENQETIKRVLSYRITPKARPLDFLFTALHELHIR